MEGSTSLPHVPDCISAAGMSDLPDSSRVWGTMGAQDACALGVQHLCSHGDLTLICSPYRGTGGEHMGWVIRVCFFCFSSPLSPAHTHAAHGGAEERGACSGRVSVTCSWKMAQL